MADKKYDYLIVGSGAGGATLAKELSKTGKQVLVIERGKYETRIGTVNASLGYYDGNRITRVPLTSKEGVILYRTFMAGGTTVVSCGNATRCLEMELSDFGIDLEREFTELEAEMPAPYSGDTLLSEGSKRIRQAARDLGYRMDIMPKFVNVEKCQKCGQCVLGCSSRAKWSALDSLDEAKQNGISIVYNTRVEQVLVENGKAEGVLGRTGEGNVRFLADVVILAAGGLGTPVILQKSGLLNGDHNLFADLFVNTYGVTQDVNLIHEPTMTLVNQEFHASRGFILSPFVSHSRLAKFIEMGAVGLTLPANRTIGIMTKIVDEANGYVHPDGTVSKFVTEKDWSKLREGSELAKQILVKAGADPASIRVSNPLGAHPGGTAAIGRVVDANLQTRVKNLFVCDASVLPTAPGLPPILTIAALAKRLAKRLN